VADVVIVEAGEPLDDLSGALVLAISARADEAPALVTALSDAGAVAVALRVGGDAVRTVAEKCGIAVLDVPAGVR
jgi:hypothetical protein